MAKKKIQVLVQDEDGSNANLWSLLEDHGFSVVAAPERKSPRYKGHPRRKVSPGDNGNTNGLSGGTGNPNGVSVDDTPPQELFEGTVKLVVVSDQRVRKMVDFVDQIRQNPAFRLLLMEATQRKDAVSIQLRLREPTALGAELMAMEDVFKVEASEQPAGESNEPVLQVTLR